MPRSVDFFPCPDKSLPRPSPECECALVGRFLFVPSQIPFLGTLQIVGPRSSLSLSLLTCSVLIVLAERKFFCCILFQFSYFFWWEIQIALNKLTSFYSDVLPLLFSPILILLMDV